MTTARYTNPDHTEGVIEYDDGRSTSAQAGKLLALAERAGVAIADWTNPRTPQQIYDEKNLAPTDSLMLSPRLIEELFDWAVNGVALPDESKAKFGPIVAERKAARAARPA